MVAVDNPNNRRLVNRERTDNQLSLGIIQDSGPGPAGPRRQYSLHPFGDSRRTNEFSPSTCVKRTSILVVMMEPFGKVTIADSP
jgi:hypothetical protein